MEKINPVRNRKFLNEVNLPSKIFLDGADPQESKEMKKVSGFLDGQTTNPTLLVKNPDIQKRIGEGRKFSEKELYFFYKEVIAEISKFASGPISIEVYADKETRAEEMLEQAREMAGWVPQSCIKLPITKEGLRAAEIAVKENISVNMTLCFSQEQAAAVYAATKGAKKPVFVSPFIGRLDDRGENGLNLIENIIKMYQLGDGHVLPLAASVRNLDHLLSALKIYCPLITVPLRIIKEWAEKGFALPDENFNYNPENLQPILYQGIALDKNWRDYNIYHQLTEDGVEKFCADWKAIIQN